MSYRERYQRKNFVSLCLNDEELSELENIAERLNMKRAAAAREILFTNSKRLKSQIKKNDNSEILFLYSKISNNSKHKTIKEVSSEVDLNRIKTVLNTLLTHYDKTLTVNKWEPARGWFLLVRGWPARSGRFFCHNFVGVFDKNLSEYFSFSYDTKKQLFFSIVILKQVS